MAARYECALTIVGAAKEVAAFERKARWPTVLKAKHLELYENSRGRVVWWFETSSVPLRALSALSRKQSKVTLLLTYEDQRLRQSGMEQAVGGRVQSCHFEY